ncbi:MAG: 50S ribosomal protein L9 [Verrucomicrobia bacterium ADurb.Bin474]|nr:MAG: 50S ribosomal protein L9 [Verrucomicrobia bacterium ADurb.Bin474]
MATTEILLLKPVDNLGGEGDQVKVKAGYARNYLLPQKVALPITQANRKYVESLKKARSMREAKELDKAQEIKGRIEKLNLVFTVKTGDEGRMFGAVTAGDLLARMASEGIELDKKQVSLYTPVKSLGKHSTKIRLHPDVSFDFEFEVVSEDQPKDGE